MVIILYIILGVVVIVCDKASCEGIRFDPILVERSVVAGETVSYTIYIDNDHPFNVITLDLHVADIYEDLRGTYQLLPPGSTTYSLAEYVTIKPTRLTIPPNSTRQVEVTCKIPRGVAGGLYGAIVMSVVAPESSSFREEVIGTTTFNVGAASFLELVLQDTRLRQEAFPVAFNVSYSSADPQISSMVGDNALIFDVHFKNVGNVHITARGSLIIQTKEGRTVARYPLGSGRGVILPTATVSIRSIITRRLPPGEYIARAVIDYGGHRPSVIEVDFFIDEEQITQIGSEVESLARFSIRPQIIEFQVRAGSAKSEIIEISNFGDEAVALRGEIFPLGFDILGDLLPLEERGIAVDWIQLSHQDIILQPGQTQRIRLTVRPPRDISGGFYADLLFVSSAEGINVETGASILIFVGEKFESAGEIEIIRVDLTEDAVSIDTLFVNRGNIHVFADVELALFRYHHEQVSETGILTPPREELLGSSIIKSEKSPVLPGEERVFRFLIPERLDSGYYIIRIRADHDGDEPALNVFRFIIQGGTEND